MFFSAGYGFTLVQDMLVVYMLYMALEGFLFSNKTFVTILTQIFWPAHMRACVCVCKHPELNSV